MIRKARRQRAGSATSGISDERDPFLFRIQLVACPRFWPSPQAGCLRSSTMSCNIFHILLYKQKTSTPQFIISNLFLCKVHENLSQTSRDSKRTNFYDMYIRDQSCLHICLSAVQIYDLSYIHLHYSPSTGILRTYKWMWPASRGLDSSVGRALHRYRRGHGFESRSGLNIFQALISKLLEFCA